MKQLVFIHGGETFDTYEDYLDALRSWEYDPRWEKQKKWKSTLADSLGEVWQVYMPSMPSKYNAKYIEWRIWFEKIIPYLEDGVILVGHSLGGLFLAKYLSEERLPISPHATFLIAAPLDANDTEYSLADFTLPTSLKGLSDQGGELFLYHSVDDDVVPFDALRKYQAMLPNARVRIFKDRRHFLQSDFPELLNEIKAIAS